MTIHIGLLDKRGLQQIRDVAAVVWPITFRDILSEEQIAYMMRMMYAPEVMEREYDAGIRFHCVYDESRPIGYIVWGSCNDISTAAKLHKCYLLPEYQGKGIGTQMLKAAQHYARQAGFSTLRLNVNRMNIKALKAYCRNGFTFVRCEDNPIGNGFFMNDYVMESSLKGGAVFTQISLFSVLLCGCYGGVVSVGEFKRLGNMGIATMDRLDGEVQMIDGVVYQACSDGQVYCPTDDATIPFGTVAAFQSESVMNLTDIHTYQDFEKILDGHFTNINSPLALRVRGTFGRMKVRSVARQENDGVGLAEAARNEAIFNLESTTGDLIGFRLPGYIKGINAPGWHLHYLDRERHHGGHVVNFDLKQATVEACHCTDYRMRLPASPEALSTLDLTRDRSQELKQAEAQR